MKILMLSNQSRSMSIFWKVLIMKMRQRGYEVICCVPAGDEASERQLRAMGARVIHYNLERKGINPLADLQTCRELKKIFQTEKPDFLFATTIKPVIYGSLAAASAGVKNIYATITGLGYAFEADTPLKKIINRISRFLYKISLRRAKGIFFQNKDDRELFLRQGILAESAPVFFARGTGVDTSHFEPAPLPPMEKDQPFVFLLMGRLLEAKGLREYAEAAKILRKQYPHAVFQILGPPEQGRGSIPIKEIRQWEPDVEYLGQSGDVRPYIAKAHVVVLPSWREGTPTSLMEAMSMGRALAATDVPGCREVVKDGENGFLAKARDHADLAKTMQKFLQNPQLAAHMGNEGRNLAINEFDAHKVAEGILQDMGVTAQ